MGASPPKARQSIEIIARGLLAHRSRILLCRNIKHGYLYLPGGHVEFDEPAAEAVQREFLEETGLRVSAGACALIAEVRFGKGKSRHHELNLVFHVEQDGRADGGADASSPRASRRTRASREADRDAPPTVRSREKGIAFEWVDRAAFVDLDIRPRAVRAWIASGDDLDKPCQAAWVSDEES